MKKSMYRTNYGKILRDKNKRIKNFIGLAIVFIMALFIILSATNNKYVYCEKVELGSGKNYQLSFIEGTNLAILKEKVAEKQVSSSTIVQLEERVKEITENNSLSKRRALYQFMGKILNERVTMNYHDDMDCEAFNDGYVTTMKFIEAKKMAQRGEISTDSFRTIETRYKKLLVNPNHRASCAFQALIK